MPSRSFRNSGLGARHMVRYVSRKASQPLKALKTLGLETRVLWNVLRFVLHRPECRTPHYSLGGGRGRPLAAQRCQHPAQVQFLPKTNEPTRDFDQGDTARCVNMRWPREHRCRRRARFVRERLGPKDVVPYHDGDRLTHATRATKANERTMQRLDRASSASITSLTCHRRTAPASTSLYL